MSLQRAVCRLLSPSRFQGCAHNVSRRCRSTAPPTSNLPPSGGPDCLSKVSLRHFVCIICDKLPLCKTELSHPWSHNCSAIGWPGGTNVSDSNPFFWDASHSPWEWDTHCFGAKVWSVLHCWGCHWFGIQVWTEDHGIQIYLQSYISDTRLPSPPASRTT